MLPTGSSEILLVRQRHEAKRAGLHFDYRLVHGDKAYSWATKKDMPKDGGAVILHEQPVHDAAYALSKEIEIPDGQYGAGITKLDYAQKGRVESKDNGDFLTLYLNNGEKYIIKKTPGYGDKQWLFKHIKGGNKYLEKAAELDPSLLAKFSPDLTPEQMSRLGVLEGKYTQGNPKKDNYFKVDASMKEWPDKWHNEEHPLGWYEWYQGYANGKRTTDDERQIKRWISFKARHLAQLQKADPTLTDLSIQPKRRQALLNWGIAPGVKISPSN